MGPELVADIRRFAEKQRERLGRLCADLVAAPSPQPEGDTRAAAEVIAAYLRDEGLHPELRACVPTKPNVLCTAGTGAPHIILNGHLDTIGVGDEAAWSVPIFEMTRAAGRLTGLGIGNMKAGTAALAVAFAYLARHPAAQGRLTYTAVSDEVVFGPHGAAWLLESDPGLQGDAVINGEGPGEFALALAEKGLLWVEVTARTAPGQGMLTTRGTSAVARLLEVLTAIDAWNDEQTAPPVEIAGVGLSAGAHRLRLSANIGRVEAGSFISQIATEARAEIDFRMPPGLTRAGLEARLDCAVRPRAGHELALHQRLGPQLDRARKRRCGCHVRGGNRGSGLGSPGRSPAGERRRALAGTRRSRRLFRAAALARVGHRRFRLGAGRGRLRGDLHLGRARVMGGPAVIQPRASLPVLAVPFASQPRPVLTGIRGAVAAAHPFAVAAGQEMLAQGGSAVDATIAAQAVLCVVAPDACGLGGDALCLVRAPDGSVTSVHGAGAAPFGQAGPAGDGGGSVTIPGIVHAWDEMGQRWGRLPLDRVLAPATHIARAGLRLGAMLARSVQAQLPRLERGGAIAWRLVTAKPGDRVVQLELANVLDRIAKKRAAAFYAGELANSICAAVQAAGGSLAPADLNAHRTRFGKPVETRWRGLRVLVQPPMSQGILLSIALAGLERIGRLPADLLDHAGIELTEASFGFRDRVGEGEALLVEPLSIDLKHASRRGGPRAYLHTAGVATSDRDGLTVSSLISVFDDFGSGVFVPLGGFVLNNRAGGFTTTPNEPGPGRFPVHTLAPIMVETSRGILALATPGADGQVQTLLQILSSTFVEAIDLAESVRRPRWRSENGGLLVEEGYPRLNALQELGHDITVLAAGHMKFGAVVCAGSMNNDPICVADWRRNSWAGVC